MKLNDQARESKRAADIAGDRYREGVIDFLQLLDAERVPLQAADNLAQVEGDVFISVATLSREPESGCCYEPGRGDQTPKNE